ncbi:hypothetical protein [Tautonia plasticadhaerens]|uniref:Uncharacterized protein n=1 Tax=Tautonia plasticadhaerens TaxID=2527974 RepID=A0A518GWZ6_9BACT|nr:hypothetical protein [Tautonia plasticadhaerens]QDV33105.1 hypothetical protein ElP_09470 [Tautonia plasticadhaerens]
MPRPARSPDRLRAAIEVLNRARESILDQMADTVLSMDEEFSEGGFQVNEFLEVHGSRLHFLCLLISQFEMLSDARSLDAVARDRPREKRARRRDESKPAPSASASPAGEDAPPASEEATNDA